MARFASPGMRCGRVWRAAVIGRTVTCQPRRAAISRMWAARAPQATISIGEAPDGGRLGTAGCAQTSTVACSGGWLEAELGDEAVVEVLAVAEFDIFHLLEEGQGGGAVADGEQGHLPPPARHVARGDDAAGADVGDKADADRGLGAEVGSEAARQEDLLNVRCPQARFLEQDAPAGGDGGLAELQLADVTLGEVDARRRVALVRPVQNEDAFLADHGETV